MRFTIRRLACLVGLFAAFGLRSQAQETPPPATVSIDFTAYGLVDAPVTDLVYNMSGKPNTIKVPAYDRSPSYKYTGPDTMLLYRTVTDDKGGKTYVPAGSVELPKGASRVMLVFSGAAPNYTIGALDDSSPGFGAGTARLCNATVFKLSIKVNDTQVVELAPGAAKVVQPKNGYVGVQVSYFKEDQWVMATSNVYGVAPTGRLHVFLLTTDNSARFLYPRAVQIYTYAEKPPTAPGARGAATPGATTPGATTPGASGRSGAAP